MADDRYDEIASVAKQSRQDANVTRDELGFVTSSQPHLSLPQVEFLLALATHGDVWKAVTMAGVDADEAARWHDDPAFRDIYADLLDNKREGVKQIGAQVLPLMLWTLTQIMQTGNNKERLTAVKLLAQTQGLLITQNTVVDKGVLEALRERLLAPRPVIKELPPRATS